jgi:hypothetical protein
MALEIIGRDTGDTHQPLTIAVVVSHGMDLVRQLSNPLIKVPPVSSEALDDACRLGRHDIGGSSQDVGQLGAAPKIEAFNRDADGKIVPDEHGNTTEVTRTSPRISHTGLQVDEKYKPVFFGAGERSGLMTELSRIPGVNAMSYLHDKVTADLEYGFFMKSTSILPYSAFTLYSTGAPFFMHLQDVTAEQDLKEIASVVPSRTMSPETAAAKQPEPAIETLAMSPETAAAKLSPAATLSSILPELAKVVVYERPMNGWLTNRMLRITQ